MPTRKLASGFTLRTYAATPRGFDIDRASDTDRTRYGFARRPGAPAELQAKLDARARRYRFVVPTFRARRTRRLKLPGLRLDHAPEQTSTWSGGVTFPAAGDSLRSVEGLWSTPAAAPPPGAANGNPYCASAWIGIDGDDGSGDVLQAGCDSDVSLSGGVAQPQYRPWWEWYPAGSAWITNMPVSPGDVLDCLITVAAGSTTTATINLANQTTGVALTFDATAPAGTALSGNCAEWIIEAFGSLGTLASYGQVTFTGCAAGSLAGATINAGAGTTIDMVDAAGAVISRGAIVNPTEVQVSYV
jgi:hypothetical protein